MERGESERSGRRMDAMWLRLGVTGLIGCLLLYGCWQAAAWFSASFPTDFR